MVRTREGSILGLYIKENRQFDIVYALIGKLINSFSL